MNADRTSPPQSDDNARYWKKRLRKRRGSLRGVGDVKRSDNENISLYATKRRIVFSLLNAVGIVDRMDGLRVLDAGCGIGMLSELFYILGAKVTGVDVSKVALKEAVHRCPDGDFRVGSLTAFKVENQRFDLIICADVLYHIVDDRNWTEAMRNLAGHAAPGGVIIVIDQIRAEPERRASHVRFRTRAMYDEVLLALGAHAVALPGKAGILAYRLPVDAGAD